MKNYDTEIDKLEKKLEKLRMLRDAEQIRIYVPIGKMVVNILGENVLDLKKAELRTFLENHIIK